MCEITFAFFTYRLILRNETVINISFLEDKLTN